MGETSFYSLSFIFMCISCHTVVDSSSRVSSMGKPLTQAFIYDGNPMMLNCTSPIPTATVSWFNPHGIQVSQAYTVMSMMKSRFSVLGGKPGQYNLYIRKATFPDDNGTWSCNIFNGPQIRTSLTVLVPPATRIPEVSPISGIIFHVDAEAYTFTCVAHYAHPPVKLTWVKKTGPLMEYNPLPMTIAIGSDYTMSASANLILTPLNHGSVFKCLAEHPTFHGHVYESEIQFIIADARYGPQAMKPPVSMAASVMGPGDVGLAVVGGLFLTAAAIACFVLVLTRKRWRLDTRYRHPYTLIPMTDTPTADMPTADVVDGVTTSNGTVPHNGKMDHKAADKNDNKEQRRCIKKLLICGILLSFIVFVLASMVPVYLRAYSIPIQGVDEMVTVVAGSLLWLDCSSIAFKSDDLLSVGWRKNFFKFYNQYNNDMLGDNYGFAINSTVESYSRGLRTQNHKLGQIAVWPVTPDDQGLYICEVARILDDTGKTVIQRKTFAVGVLTGMPVNRLLIALSILGLIAALALVVLVCYHSLRCVPLEKKVDESMDKS